MAAPATSRVPLSFKAAVFLAALAVGVGLCELGARLAFPAPPDPTRQPQIGYLYDPEIRYTNVPNQRGWIDDGFVTLNSLGFRGPETAIPKPPGRFRIVLIGDSLTLGWGVADNETYAVQLEQRLKRQFPGRDLDVVNLGVGGYDTRQEVVLLKRNIERLQPDLVLVGFYTNDVPDGLEDARALAASSTRVAAVNPQVGQVMHMNPAPNSSWERVLRHSRAAYVMGRTLRRFTNSGEWGMTRFSMELDVLNGKDSPELDQAWEGVETQFGVLRTAAQSRFNVGVVVLPCREQISGGFPNARYQTRVSEIADRAGFFVVDPMPLMIHSGSGASKLFIPYDRNHPSAAGHDLIAEAIFETLQARRDALGLTPGERLPGMASASH